MASNTSMHSPTSYGSDPTIGNTTFVQADPSNFREVVQRLTGAPEEASAEKLPLTTLPSSRVATTQTHKPTTTAEMIGPKKKPSFKLQERRHGAKMLELSIGVSERPLFNGSMSMSNMNPSPSPSPSPISPCWYVGKSNSNRGEMVMVSPVSPLEVVGRGSPRTPQEEMEERAIAEKGFYLHPTTPRASHHPPQLLSLFPLHNQTNSS